VRNGVPVPSAGGFGLGRPDCGLIGCLVAQRARGPRAVPGRQHRRALHVAPGCIRARAGDPEQHDPEKREKNQRALTLGARPIHSTNVTSRVRGWPPSLDRVASPYRYAKATSPCPCRPTVNFFDTNQNVSCGREPQRCTANTGCCGCSPWKCNLVPTYS
jgi:hypothetical protein